MTLWRSNSRARDALAQADAISKSQAVIEFNMDGTVITANPNFLEAMGYKLPEIAGHGELDQTAVAHAEHGEARMVPSAGHGAFAIPMVAGADAVHVFGLQRHERTDRVHFARERSGLRAQQRAARIDAEESTVNIGRAAWLLDHGHRLPLSGTTDPWNSRLRDAASRMSRTLSPECPSVKLARPARMHSANSAMTP